MNAIQAHFDGKQILLDEPIHLAPNTRLLVTIINDADEEHKAWHKLSSQSLEQAYDEKEEDYPLNLIKEANSDYEGS